MKWYLLALLFLPKLVFAAIATPYVDPDHTHGQTKIKDTFECLQSDINAQDDDHLFATLETGVYSFEMFLYINSPPTADFKMNLAAQDSLAGVFSNQCVYVSESVVGQESDAGNGFTDIYSFSTVSSSATTTATCHGGVEVSTAGTMRLRWSQNISITTNTCVLAGSWLRVEKLAD